MVICFYFPLHFRKKHLLKVSKTLLKNMLIHNLKYKTSADFMFGIHVLNLQYISERHRLLNIGPLEIRDIVSTILLFKDLFCQAQFISDIYLLLLLHISVPSIPVISKLCTSQIFPCLDFRKRFRPRLASSVKGCSDMLKRCLCKCVLKQNFVNEHSDVCCLIQCVTCQARSIYILMLPEPVHPAIIF